MTLFALSCLARTTIGQLGPGQNRNWGWLCGGEKTASEESRITDPQLFLYANIRIFI